MLYLLRGKIIHGRKRGKEFGFPTINIRLHQELPVGIYVSTAKFDRKTYRSVSFIGPAKTFGETEIFAETYIFDFSRDVYGKWVSVKLLKKIRGNKKFASSSELIAEMNRDKQKTIEYFSKAKLIS